MIYECDICNKKFKAQGSLEQHKNMAHSITENVKGKINFKKYFIIVGLILIVGLVSVTAYMKSTQPGVYDDFAKCLTEKGVAMYGNDYCSYTTKQLGFFGKSKKYLNYVKCVDNEALCNSKGVEVTPTWEINGEMYSQVQDFEMLSSVSGCEL